MIEAARDNAAEIERAARSAREDTLAAGAEAASGMVEQIDGLERELSSLLRNVAQEADGLRAQLDRAKLGSAFRLPSGREAIQGEAVALDAALSGTTTTASELSPVPPEVQAERVAGEVEGREEPPETEEAPKPAPLMEEAPPEAEDGSPQTDTEPFEAQESVDPDGEATQAVEGSPEGVEELQADEGEDPNALKGAPEEGEELQADEVEGEDPNALKGAPEEGEELQADEVEGEEDLDALKGAPEEGEEIQADEVEEEDPNALEDAPEYEEEPPEDDTSSNYSGDGEPEAGENPPEASFEEPPSFEEEQPPEAVNTDTASADTVGDDRAGPAVRLTEAEASVSDKTDLDLAALHNLASARAVGAEDDEEAEYWRGVVWTCVEEAAARPKFGVPGPNERAGGRRGKKQRTRVLNALREARAGALDTGKQADSEAGPPSADSADLRPDAEQRVPEFGTEKSEPGLLSRMGRRGKKGLFVTTPGHCAVCHNTFMAGSEEELRASGWKVTGDVGLCPEDQADGWQLPEGAVLPYRRGGAPRSSSTP